MEIGFVKSIREFLIHLDGLPTVRPYDLVENEAGKKALINNLLPDRVEALLLDEAPLLPGEIFHTTGKKLEIVAGNFLLGRSINPLSVPIDGKGPLGNTKTDPLVPLDKTATGISTREIINKQLETGITLVDTIIPIGRGQRELIIGDARSGKTNFLIDLIVNQKDSGVVCIYAAIGKPVAEVRGLIDLLENNKAMDHTIVVASSSTDLAPLIFLTPQTALAIAEYFQSQGKDVLVILDDMGIHAKIYREISLLSGKSPGRESYPGDIFYQHSHLLERAGNYKGGVSITALPVIELNLNDFTSFIPTNLMSMTDGHLLFRSTIYNQGRRPAIDISLSVSRVGAAAQKRAQHIISTKIKQILARASELETISRFSFELPAATRLILKQKECLEELMKQPPLTYIGKELQAVLLALPFTNFITDKEVSNIKEEFNKIVEILNKDSLKPLISQVLETESEQDLFAKMNTIVEQINQGLNLPIPPTPNSQPITTNQQPPTNNHQPITTNHEPITNNHEPK